MRFLYRSTLNKKEARKKQFSSIQKEYWGQEHSVWLGAAWITVSLQSLKVHLDENQQSTDENIELDSFISIQINTMTGHPKKKISVLISSTHFHSFTILLNIWRKCGELRSLPVSRWGQFERKNMFLDIKFKVQKLKILRDRKWTCCCLWCRLQ